MSDTTPHRFAIPGITYTCPFIHKIASVWGYDTAHWLPASTADRLPADFKQRLARLAQESGREGRAAAHALIAESVERRESAGGGREGFVVDDVEYALVRLVNGMRLEGAMNEAAPQRRRRPVEPGRVTLEGGRGAAGGGTDGRAAAATGVLGQELEDEDVALAFKGLCITEQVGLQVHEPEDGGDEEREGMDYDEDFEDSYEDDGYGRGQYGDGRPNRVFCANTLVYAAANTNEWVMEEEEKMEE